MGDSVKWVHVRFSSRGPWQFCRKKRERESEEKLKHSVLYVTFIVDVKKGCYINVRMRKILLSNSLTFIRSIDPAQINACVSANRKEMRFCKRVAAEGHVRMERKKYAKKFALEHIPMRTSDCLLEQCVCQSIRGTRWHVVACSKYDWCHQCHFLHYSHASLLLSRTANKWYHSLPNC